MARYARELSLEHFKRLLYKKLSRNLYVEDLKELGDYRRMEFDWAKLFTLAVNEEPFSSIRAQDLKKVKFEIQHILFNQEEKFLGFHKAGLLSFAGMHAGGDWEWPVHFILYVNEKNQIRAYIPKKGNLFNQKNQSAYGNEWKLDNKDAHERFGVRSFIDLGREHEDVELMLQEIQRVINIRPSIEDSIHRPKPH